ncbi:MAG: EAL domain-containing protein [Gammaproteobacteria bacterium]|nr:EAL domain-containing protein [Gammaproteobacteria bacterium]
MMATHCVSLRLHALHHAAPDRRDLLPWAILHNRIHRQSVSIQSDKKRDTVAFDSQAALTDAERTLLTALARAREQMQVVGEISQAKEILAGDVENLARTITERAAATVGCERVNVWLFDETETSLRCIDAFTAGEKSHTSGAVLTEAQYRNEFRALKESRYVAADDPLSDPRTIGYIDSYLKPLGITSMLDAVIQISGKHLGLLCFEHVGRPHHWEHDEIAFAEQLADKLGLALVSRARRSVEAALRASVARFRVLLDQAPDAILVYDYDQGRFTDANESAELLFGSSRKELIATGPERFYSSAEGDSQTIRASVDSRNLRALAGEKLTFDCKIRNTREEELVCEVHMAQLPSAEGERLIRSSFVDVTEQRLSEERLQFANTLLASEIESAPDGVLVVDTSTGLASWNAKFQAMWGLLPATVASRNPDAVLAEVLSQVQQPDEFKADVARFRADPASTIHRELDLIDGRAIECHAGSMWAPSGKRLGRISFFRDVTARKRDEEELRQSEERFRAVSENAPDAIIIFDSSGKIVYWNRTAEHSLQYTAQEADGMDIREILASSADKERATAGLRKFAEIGKAAIPAGVFELAARRKDGTEIPVDMSFSAMQLLSLWHAVAFVRDIIERKQSEKYMHHLAQHDALTGLANRRVFVDAMGDAIARAQRGGAPFAVLYLDLDHFKDINDTLGHPVGDLVLQEIARRLLSVARATDTVARFGGDEFAILQTDLSDPADAAAFADRILVSIAVPFDVGGNEIRTGASIGISFHDESGGDAEKLLSQADVALYRAKSEGRGTFRYFTEAMDIEVRTRVRLAMELRQALVMNQLFVHYQPQVEIETGRIVGVEALMRWDHPERGLISPTVFVPIAEKTGLIVALGQWILQEACRQARSWLDAGIPPILIAVNLSGVQFKNPHELETQVSNILAETGLPRQHLELELTESMLMEASQEHNDVLLRLRASGLRLAIDDFGTGYSSLDYLRRFPVDRIKIAQNFIAELTSSSGDAAIVKAALSLARELGIPVIVEGVETAAQLNLLKMWGCREVQGFYYSKPLLAADIAPLLRAGVIAPAQDFRG